jgi:hypothetical protein
MFLLSTMTAVAHHQQHASAKYKQKKGRKQESNLHSVTRLALQHWFVINIELCL